MCVLFKFSFCVDLKSYPSPPLRPPLAGEDQILKHNTVKPFECQIPIMTKISMEPKKMCTNVDNFFCGIASNWQGACNWKQMRCSANTNLRIGSNLNDNLKIICSGTANSYQPADTNAYQGIDSNQLSWGWWGCYGWKMQTDLLGSLELQIMMNFPRISENTCIFVALDFPA